MRVTSHCANHPSKEAGQRCRSCHTWLCDSCVHRYGRHVYCGRGCQLRGVAAAWLEAAGRLARHPVHGAWAIAFWVKSASTVTKRPCSTSKSSKETITVTSLVLSSTGTWPKTICSSWLTAASKVITHPVFDIMADDFRSPVTRAYVGETLNLRVIDLGADVGDGIDQVTVLMQAKSGAKAWKRTESVFS